MKTGWLATGCLLFGLLAGCGSASAARLGAAAETSPSPSASTSPGTETLPAGWRWESYQGIEVGVPGAWGYGITDEPWCLRDGQRMPYVGRPGFVRTVGCLSYAAGPDPATLAKIGGTFVWFGESLEQPGGGSPGLRGDRQTLSIGGVGVAVQAPARLQRQIVATIHRVTVDQNGCAARRPFARGLTWRPANGVSVGDLTGVRSVAACKYEFATGRLVGSVRRNGADAARAVSAVAALPVGSGPNAPASCLRGMANGNQLIVLEVEADQGRHEIALRFDGCDHHGFDDGRAVRALTRNAVLPFTAGPNRVTAFSGELDGILNP